MWKCIYCNKEFNNLNPSQKANHSRWCISNPKRNIYTNNLNYMRSCITPEIAKKRNNSIKLAWNNGKYSKVDFGAKMRGKHLSEEAKRKISIAGLNNKYQRVCKSTVIYKGIKLDSKYEVRVAEILDKNNIKWTRGSTLLWIDKGNKQHNYYPDFYLIDYDVYLDPKNSYCFVTQKEKIDYIKAHYKNVFFLTEEQINENYILNLW